MSAGTGSAIVHLIGYPGVGKYTVAKELVRLADGPERRFVLVDNHLTSNVIFAVLPVDGSEAEPLPDVVWDRVDDVRAALLRTIEELSPADWSFIFTNVALEGDPADLRSVDRVRALAAARGSRYLPVRLRCDADEHLRRVVQPDRTARNKWTDADAVRAYSSTADLISIDDPAPIDIDVTHRSPELTAALILDHLAAAHE